MKAAELSDGLWEFLGELTDGCEVHCPKCGQYSPLRYWREGEVWCEDCGEHAALVCPACEAMHDHVWAEPFEVRPAAAAAAADGGA